MSKNRNQLTTLILESAPEVVDAIGELLAAGGDRDAVVRAAAKLVDGAIDWREELPKRIPGPVGQLIGAALEASDGPLLMLVLRPIVNEVADRISKEPAQR